MVSRGNLMFAGTATKPARMMAKYAMSNSARLSERMATRRRAREAAGGRARAQAFACRSSSPWECRAGAPSRDSRSPRITVGCQRDRPNHRD